MMRKPNQKIISPTLITEIKDALESVKYGSIEIFVQNKVVTQITVRNIHKTSVEIDPERERIHASTQSESSNIADNVIVQKHGVKIGRS